MSAVLPKIDRLDAQAAAWAVLGRLLAEAPSQADLDRVRDEGMLASWPLPSDRSAEKGLALLRASRESGEDERAVRDDHLRLFRGAGKVLAPPWASVHLGDEGLMFDEETLRVRAAYAAHDLQVPGLHREPDDHIAVELAFCAELLLRALDAAESGDAARAAELVAAHDAFVTDHLAPFAPEFFALVARHATTDFHRGVAALGVHALAQAQR